ncbi:MAG TPA: hypothetical protein VGI39_46610 [Polyangiaceae bacterium]|jgi:hypothetical protein
MRHFTSLLTLSAFSAQLLVAPLAHAADAPAAPPAPAAAAATPAPAPPIAGQRVSGEDEVILKNGGLLRGEITVADPNKSITILIEGSGESRTIPWDQVDHFARGVHAAAPAPAPVLPAPVVAPAPPPPPAPPPEPLLGPGMPRVHIQTENPQVQLHRYMGTAITGYHTTTTYTGHGTISSTAPVSTTLSEVICRVPCDTIVDGRNGDEFFFAGKGVTPSPKFQLFNQSGDLTAAVQPGSKGARVGGLVSLLLGGVAAVTGGTLMIIGANTSSTTSSFESPSGSMYGNYSTTSSSSGQGLTTAGEVALGVGAAAIIAGIILLTNSKTTYTILPSQPARAAQR